MRIIFFCLILERRSKKGQVKAATQQTDEHDGYEGEEGPGMEAQMKRTGSGFPLRMAVEWDMKGGLQVPLCHGLCLISMGRYVAPQTAEAGMG